MRMLGKTSKLLVAAALITGLSASAMAKDKVYKWKLATTWGPTLTPFIDAPKKMAKMVKEMSNGRLIIRVDASNKHKSAFGILDMVKGGQYDMGHSASYYWKGKDINTMPFSTMPFGMTTPEQYAWFYYGGGEELMKKVYKKHKTSLERGNIDALEWVGPGMDVKMGFHKVAPYYYTGWHEPGLDLQFLVNKRKFNKLPKDLQAILVAAMRVSANDMYLQNYDMSATAWAKIKTNYPNIKIKTFPKKVMDAMKKTNKELIAEKTKGHPLLKEILDSQATYQKKVREWTKMSDYQYLKDNL